MTATIWDSTNETTSMTLSGGNLTATSTAVGTVAATRTFGGLTYFEVLITTLTGVLAVGLVNRAYNMASGTILGSDNNGIGFKSSGAVVLNGVTLSTIQTYVTGNVVCVAVNPVLQLIWFRTNAGNWNNSGTANPATGVGGISYATMVVSALLPAASASLTGAVMTATFTSGFTFTAPTGFVTVDTTQVGVSVNGNRTSTPSLHPQSTFLQSCFQKGSAFAYLLWTPSGPTKSVSGTVSINGVLGATTVRLYDGMSGLLLGTTISNPTTGAFTIPSLGKTNCFVVATDAGYQAQIFDQVVPV